MSEVRSTDLVTWDRENANSNWRVFVSGEFHGRAGRVESRLIDEIERLRAAMTQACSDMGCYCADDDPLPDNLKCPMCKLEKALHG